jgi:hypothetical protein
MVEVLISQTPSVWDMRDGLVILPSLGSGRSVTTCLGIVTFLNVVDVFIILRDVRPVNPFPK